MAILKRLYRTKTTRQHEAYQKYVKETKGKKPLSFKMWAGSWGAAKAKPKAKLKRKTPVKKISRDTVRTRDITGGLRRAGISEKNIRKLRSK